MAINLIRYRQRDEIRWGVALVGGIVPLSGHYPTTSDLIARGESDWRAAVGGSPTLQAKAGPAQEFGQIHVDSGPVVIPELASLSRRRPSRAGRADQPLRGAPRRAGRPLPPAASSEYAPPL